MWFLLQRGAPPTLVAPPSGVSLPVVGQGCAVGCRPVVCQTHGGPSAVAALPSGVSLPVVGQQCADSSAAVALPSGVSLPVVGQQCADSSAAAPRLLCAAA